MRTNTWGLLPPGRYKPQPKRHLYILKSSYLLIFDVLQLSPEFLRIFPNFPQIPVLLVQVYHGLLHNMSIVCFVTITILIVFVLRLLLMILNLKLHLLIS